MFRIELELTEDELMALGFALAAGERQANDEGLQVMRDATASLYAKVHEAEQRLLREAGE